MGEELGRAPEVAYIDTHIAVWLAQGAGDKLTTKAATAINESESLLISPIVLLELEYLYERGKIAVPGADVISHLGMLIDLQICRVRMTRVVQYALSLKWTRDPFDRIIVAQAGAAGNIALVTADEQIRKNYPKALWD